MNSLYRYLLSIILVGLHCAVIEGTLALSQLPPEGVIFDDFSYTSVEWCSEVNNGCPDATMNMPPEGSIFGVNFWHTSIKGAGKKSRSWYRYLWQEQDDEHDSTLFRMDSYGVPKSIHHLTLGAKKGDYEKATARQVISGFTARRGTWAERVNFGDLEPADVLRSYKAFGH